MNAIAVIGGGAFGTAMAAVAARTGASVRIWAREPDVVEEINASHTNTPFLKGIPLDHAISATESIAEACLGAQMVLLVPPAQHLRSIGAEVAGSIREGIPVAICSKGIERGTGALLSEAAADAMPGHTIAILSGPTFADELAKGLPAAVTLACRDEAAASTMASALRTRSFKAYVTDDIIGAQVGGAVKNVMAIAAGISSGLEMGESARAAIITRGLAEMARLGMARGARPETLMGLSGMGDLMLTCVSPKSRNTSLGMELAKGRSLAEVLGERVSVAEGVFTAAALADLSKTLGIDMPITHAVNAVLTEAATPAEAIESLLMRPLKREWA
jgi:glycerol-3-phosphate dehydrogenase (NAD(P)+)